ncbi:MAG: AAA family ATPase [Syntrophales bacterium]|nr:AAA family ATPase [Syntrophales bacterium]
MSDDVDTEIGRLAGSLERGSIIAAAGCGKTEQIARATKFAVGRRLIMTHTHAGVDALRMRLKKYGVPNIKFRVDTIAGWCLWYSTSYPKRSGLVNLNPRTNAEWNSVYESAIRLIESGAVSNVLKSSYSGVFVDEYQDCTTLQHRVILAIADHLRVCVFGDPLQAIFDFAGQEPVDWVTDVFPIFKKSGELTKPWRWYKSGNIDLANWLENIRHTLEAYGTIDLTGRPECVSWERLPSDPHFQRSKIIGACKDILGKASNERIVVIGDPASIDRRAALAQSLAKAGYSNIEPLSCKHLYEFATKLEETEGPARLECVLDFICACMTGGEKAEFLSSVKSHQNGGKRGVTKFGDLISLGVALVDSPTDESVLTLMKGFYELKATNLFRPEMFFAMRSGIKNKSLRGACKLSDVICEVQNRTRHAGRRLGKRSVGSTLLVKGLEFDHTIIIYDGNMSIKDWYVALTRATTSVTILSPSEYISPKAAQNAAKRRATR